MRRHVSSARVTSRTHLGRDVVGRAAERRRLAVAHDVLLAHAEVGDLDVTFFVEQHVVQLQIPATVPTYTRAAGRQHMYM